MSPRERRQDRRTVLVLLLADASALGLLASAVVWRYHHTGLSPLDLLFAWLMLISVVLFFAHLDTLWQGRHASPVTPKPSVTPCKTLDHVYRRDGETVVCTKCADRRALAPAPNMDPSNKPEELV